MQHFYNILSFLILVIFSPFYLDAQNLSQTSEIILKVNPQVVKQSPQATANYLLEKYASYGLETVEAKFPILSSHSFYAQQLTRIYKAQLTSSTSLSKALYQLNQKPDIEYAEPLNTQATPQNDPYYTNDTHWKKQEWYFEKIKMYESWGITKGDPNVVIGIIDVGFQLNHPDLENQWVVNEIEKFGVAGIDDDNNGKIDDVIGWDFGNDDNDVNGDRNTSNAVHGTQVAGIASAQADNQLGIAGVGFQSRLMPIKVQDNQGFITDENLYEAMVYAVENGCQILNISLTSKTTQPLQWQQEIIDYVVNEGVLIVAATGSQPDAEVNLYPASYQNVLSVSGVGYSDEHIKGYPFNTEIDLVAPALNIPTTDSPNTYFMQFRGTSASAPLVAGAAALVKAKYPALSGMQIGELLRVTTDSIYQQNNNQDYFEKLGKGRLNIYRALTEFDSVDLVHSVRLVSTDYYTKYGRYAFREDTVKLKTEFVNFLKPIKNLTIKLTTQSPYVKFLTDSLAFDSLKTLEKLEAKYFDFQLQPDTPPETQIKFRIQFKADNYTDYQYFTIKTSPEYLTNFNDSKLKITATANGRIGYVDDQFQKGNGVTYQNQQVLQEAGLIIGLSPLRLSSSVRETQQRISDDFDIQRNVRFTKQNFLYLQSEALFTDNLQERTNKVGVDIHQKVISQTAGLHRNYTIIQYDIENKSPYLMNHLKIGIYADWNIGIGKNKANWDEEGEFGYIFEDNGQYFGIKAFGDSRHYMAIDKNMPDNFTQEEFSIHEKYQAISQGIIQKEAGYETNGSDVAQVVSTSIKLLTPKKAKSVYFVIAGADNLTELRTIFQLASNALDSTASKSPLPKMDSILCNQKQLYLSPSNGTKFNFYAANNLREPIHTGDSLPVTLADTSKVYYISCIDSVRESAFLKYQFRVYLPDIQFDMPDKFNLKDSSIIHFFDRSPNVVSRIWDFGDGSELLYDVPYPIHRFRQLGSYDVSLTIVDTAGCVNQLTRRLNVVHEARSPRPKTPDFMSACPSDTIRIIPDNGTTFRFFSIESRRRSSPLHVGSEFSVTNAEFDKILITNTDSTFESPIQVLTIDWGKIIPDFEYESKADTLWNAPILFTDKSNSDLPIIQRIWDFGDGTVIQNDSVNTISHIYTKAGVYQVQLKLTNQRGCIDSISYEIIAGSKSPIPTISDTIFICPNDAIELIPQGGTDFNFYTNSLDNFITTSNKLIFYPQENQTIYITNVDSVLESYPAKTTLIIYDSFFDFDFPNPLRRSDFKEVKFENLTKNISVSHWNFGDGNFSTVTNPVHHYLKQGTFSVTLNATDSNGCTAQIEKQVQVFSESPVPNIDTLIQVCANTPVTLKPTNGKTFSFYESSNLNTPIFTGNEFSLPKLVHDKTYYITNTDSILESKPIIVRLQLSAVHAHFLMSTKTINLEDSDSLQVQSTYKNAQSWHWDFGNGEFATAQTASTKYTHGGIYSIQLKVTDSLGCEMIETQILEVAPKLIPQSLATQTKIFPNPSTNKLWFLKVKFKQPKTIQIQLFNLWGRELKDFTTKYLAIEKQIPFDMTDYPKGIYILKLQVDDETLIRRIVLE